MVVENKGGAPMKQYISISCLPLPTFIEGNEATFYPGDRHPNRTDLQYFVLIFMTKGTLYIAENGKDYTVSAGEMMILLPKHHHYSWKAIDEETHYYWVHFYVSGHWTQANSPTSMRPTIEVPTLHYNTPILTLHLGKHTRIPEFDKVLDTVKKLFDESTKSQSFGFWRAQQLFIDVLQFIQVHSKEESKLNELADQVQRYLRDNYAQKITSESLSAQFHFHPNYISRALKQTVGLTPAEFLVQYRMEEAEKRLLNTEMTISEIAESLGFQNVYYFSTSFKKYTGMAPQKYRSEKQV